MADKLKVIIKNTQKEVKIQTGVRMLLRRCCHAVLENEGFKGSAELQIDFMDNACFEKASMECMGYVNNVEFFSVSCDDELNGVKKLGNVYMSVEKAYQKAESLNQSSQRRLAYLTAHGVLELLGYPVGVERNITKNDKVEMALVQLGLNARPNYYYFA